MTRPGTSPRCRTLAKLRTITTPMRRKRRRLKGSSPGAGLIQLDPTSHPGSPKDTGGGARGGDFNQLLRAELTSLGSEHLLRARRMVRQVDATHVELDDGRRLTNFAGNDYLGVSRHAGVLAAASEVIRAEGFGSGASALIS